MKTMKYIVTTIALTIAMSINAQFAEIPQTGFQSTSTMEGTGSYLPSAAESGVVMAETPSEQTPNRIIRKSRPDSQDHPADTPIGDGLWVLMAMAGGAALLRKRKANAN